ncbi:MAG: hypothetical protein PHE55_18055 [Methylococcaceae bacterium]|nr:hypothetical protein [Methylococcaceae bacterium]
MIAEKSDIQSMDMMNPAFALATDGNDRFHFRLAEWTLSECEFSLGAAAVDGICQGGGAENAGMAASSLTLRKVNGWVICPIDMLKVCEKPIIRYRYLI